VKMQRSDFLDKIGIMSSFNVLCGNATYSEEIYGGLQGLGVDIVKIEVPSELQYVNDNREVKRLTSAAAECRAVNIQCELGLFGPTPGAAAKNLVKIVRSARHSVITMHRVDARPRNIIRKLYSQIRSRGFKALFGGLKVLQDIYLYRCYAAVVRAGVSKSASFIVHTNRERQRVLAIESKANVRVFPIVWPESKHVQPVTLDPYFSERRPVIGLFGFVSAYKNYEIIAEGLIDENYNVLIAGGDHPANPFFGQSSFFDNFLSNTKKTGGGMRVQGGAKTLSSTKRRRTGVGNSLSYIRVVSNLFSGERFNGRVHWITAPSDEDLVRFIKSVDVCVIPYLETGQSMSGVASLAVINGKKVIFSYIKSTIELKKFLVNSDLVVFDPDSALGLKGALRDVMNNSEAVRFRPEYTFEQLLEMKVTLFNRKPG
jgi:hypothetical protein